MPWLQVILAVLLIAAILFQQNQAGLGGAFGGGGEFFQAKKRGLEKQLFIATIVVAVLFVAISILALYL